MTEEEFRKKYNEGDWVESIIGGAFYYIISIDDVLVDFYNVLSDECYYMELDAFSRSDEEEKVRCNQPINEGLNLDDGVPLPTTEEDIAPVFELFSSDEFLSFLSRENMPDCEYYYCIKKDTIQSIICDVAYNGLGSNIQIKTTANGKTIEIYFNDQEDAKSAYRQLIKELGK